MDITKQKSPKNVGQPSKQRTYAEVIEFLDKQWNVSVDTTLERMKKLDAAFDYPSKKVAPILVAGTNGKSLTIYFTTQLFKAEGLKVGTFSSPHILTYNERLGLNNEAISNKLFTEIANDVIATAEKLGIDAHSQEVLTMMALLYFVQEKTDIAIFEVADETQYSPVNICTAKVATITRVTNSTIHENSETIAEKTRALMSIVKKGTHIVSGDQSKATLQLMQDLTEEQGGHWAMPIRKLAPLNYPFEQLHGRCAALAERIAQLYVEHFMKKDTTILINSLLMKQKGQRGRPTIEAKRELEINPRKTVEQFWKEVSHEIPGKFQLLDKEKPTLLLDTANNIDAIENLLLGIRLLHYQRPLKGLTIIIGAASDTLHNEEFLKLCRYFFKKTSGQLLICPNTEVLAGTHEEKSWNVEQVANDLKSMKIKAKACKNFEEAFELAKKSVDERHGLVVITGSQSIVSQYWHNKGIKKF